MTYDRRWFSYYALKTGVEVASSADLVQYFQTRWSPEQLAGHRVAARALIEIKDLAFAEITRHVSGKAGE